MWRRFMMIFTDGYINWIKLNTVITPLPNGWTEISTPFMDSHNDGLVIYAKKEQDEVVLSDNGYFIEDMELYGSVNQQEIRDFFHRYGITVTDDKELPIRGSLKEYPAKQHALLQAMMVASHLFLRDK